MGFLPCLGRTKFFVALLIVLLTSLGFGLGAGVQIVAAIEQPGEQLDEIGIAPQLGAEIDLSLPFTSSEGTRVVLSELLNPNQPAIFIPVYYRCPRLCGLLMGGVTTLLRELTLKLDQDFQVIVFSIAPTESAEEAAEAKVRYSELAELSTEQRSAFHFLVGEAQSISSLTEQLGFKYLPDGVDFAHSAGLILTTPTGRISQYFTGIEFHPFDAKLALVEASEGKIGTALDHIMLYCFRFDPTKGKYTWVMTGALRIAGVLTLLFLGSVIGGLIWRERRKSRLRGC